MNNIDREKIIFILGNLKQSEKCSIIKGVRLRTPYFDTVKNMKIDIKS